MCCKKIKQILFPLNIFGKDKRSFKKTVPNPPYTDVQYTVDWMGERLDICFTQLVKIGINPLRTYPNRIQFVDSLGEEETVIVHQRAILNRREWVKEIYFNWMICEIC